MIVQLVVASGNRTGQIVPISTEKFIIGRAADCHLKPRSELISRYHCAILVGDDVVVRDLGSKNGIRLNGEKVSAEQKLTNGDRLVVGPLDFYVHVADDVTGLPEDNCGHSAVTGCSQIHDANGPFDSTATVLLDHLKTLNQGTNTEPEKPIFSLLKKFS